MKFILILTLFLINCSEYKTNGYKYQLEHSKYKIGDIITVDQGFYIGCKLEVEKIKPVYDAIIYYGKSECPIKGVSDSGTYK